MKLQIYFLIIASQLLIFIKIYLIIYFTFFKNFKKSYALIKIYKINENVYILKNNIYLSKSDIYLLLSKKKLKFEI